MAVAIALAIGGCVHPTSQDATDAPAAASADRVQALVAMDARVAPVAWRLAVANTALCPVTRLRAGWTLQAASQYGTETRPAAERLYGLQGDLPGISAVAPDSPASRAGLSAGDLIVAADGVALQSGRGPGSASYDGLDANAARLDDALQRGPVRLTVRRAGHERTAVLTPVQACAYETQVEITGTLRSHADGRRVFISDALLALLPDDDQLAFVLAHELGHNVLEHRTDRALSGQPGALVGAIRLRKGLSIRSEADADQAAIWLMARAGYDPRAGLGFFDSYAAADPGARFPQANAGGIYASMPERKRALAPVIDAVEARRREGADLIP